jgi:peptide/nickel transport system substrate-binding protein
MQLRVLGVGFVTGVLVLAGCTDSASENGSGAASAEPHRGGVATLGTSYEPPSLDPALCGGSASFSHCEPVFDTLLRYDYATQKTVPQLAQSFETTDGKTWTLKLREGVTFSDGTPLNADAVVFNWDRIRDPKTLSPALGAVAGVQWEKVDDLTVKVNLDKVNYQMPTKLAVQLGCIGSPAAIQSAGAEVGSRPVGAGPFTLTKWTRGTEADYAANPHYWQKGLPYLDGLVIKNIPDDNQRLNAFLSGDLTVGVSVRTQETKMVKDAGYEIVGPVPMTAGTGFGMNLRDPLLQDADLRAALLYGLDVQQIENAVYPGDIAPDALLTPGNPIRDDKAGLYPKFDLQQAQQRFDAYLNRAGKSSETLTLTAFSGSPALEQGAQLMQAQLGEIRGLTVKLETVDIPTVVSRLTAGKFQLIQGPSNLPVNDGLYDTYHTGGTLNSYGYSNPKVDAALDVTRTSSDPKVAAEAYGQAAGEISQDPPLRYYRYLTPVLWPQHSVHGLTTLTVFGSGIGVYWENVWLEK